MPVICRYGDSCLQRLKEAPADVVVVAQVRVRSREAMWIHAVWHLTTAPTLLCIKLLTVSSNY